MGVNLIYRLGSFVALLEPKLACVDEPQGLARVSSNFLPATSRPLKNKKNGAHAVGFLLKKHELAWIDKARAESLGRTYIFLLSKARLDSGEKKKFKSFLLEPSSSLNFNSAR